MTQEDDRKVKNLMASVFQLGYPRLLTVPALMQHNNNNTIIKIGVKALGKKNLSKKEVE